MAGSRGIYTPPGTVTAPANTSGVTTYDESGKVNGVKYVGADGKIVSTYQYDPSNTGQLVSVLNEGEKAPDQKFDAGLMLQEYGIYVVAGLFLLFKLKR